jgi:hypothetical protein
MTRFTPEEITELAENEIFVFGSNLSGRHGKGAAKTAMGWGAIYGQGVGLQGRTYGIPTKNASITQTLPLTKIQLYIAEFLNFAETRPDLTFLVTKLGCGLAGLTTKQIGNLFSLYEIPGNVVLPREFGRKCGQV